MRFRFLDGVASTDGVQNGKIVTQVTFPLSEDYVGGPFHNAGQIPFTIILEALAASGGRLIEVVTKDKAVALMVKVEDASFLSMVNAGDKLLVHSEILGLQDKTGARVGLGRTLCRGVVDKKPVAEANIVYLCMPSQLTRRKAES